MDTAKANLNSLIKESATRRVEEEKTLTSLVQRRQQEEQRLQVIEEMKKKKQDLEVLAEKARVRKVVYQIHKNYLRMCVHD